MSKRRLASLASLALLLGACTGTEEPASPVNLALLDGASTLQLVTVTGTATPGSPVTVPLAPETVTDVGTVRGGAEFALSFPGHIQRRDAALGNPTELTPVSPAAPLPDSNGASFRPCYRQLAVSPSTLRLAALSDPRDPDSSGDTLNCPPGPQVPNQQTVAVYDLSANGERVYQVSLPATGTPTGVRTDVPTGASVSAAADTHLAPLNDGTLIVARRYFTSADRSSVFRVTPDNNTDTDLLPQLEGPVDAPFIYDLAVEVTNQGNTVYAATNAGVQPVTSTLALGPAEAGFSLGSPPRRLFSGQNLLAAWYPELARAPLIVRNSAGAILRIEDLTDLRDVIFSPDGFLYTLQGTQLTRFDIIGFNTGNTPGNLNRTPIYSGVSDGRAGAYALPVAPASP